MSGRIAVIAAVGLVVAFVVARRDDDAPDRADTAPSHDLSDLFRGLLDDGPSAAPMLRDRLEKDDPGGFGRDLIALLPDEGESWNSAVDDLISDPPPDPLPAPRIVEPEGRRTRGGGRILVRRPMPGRVDVRVARTDGGGDGELVFEVPIGRWEWFPEELVLEPGATYSFVAHAQGGDELVAASTVTTLSEQDEAAYRAKMKLLRTFVAEARVRLYMQAVIAMSGGLHGEATEILTRKLERLAPPAPHERGLHRRLAWLHHRRGSLDRRDASLERLR